MARKAVLLKKTIAEVVAMRVGGYLRWLSSLKIRTAKAIYGENGWA
jgi:hypothetical protein